MDAQNVSTLANFAVALFTGFLAIATYLMARRTGRMAEEARLSRVSVERERERTLLRTALVEQFDNCRYWAINDPIHRNLAIHRLRQPPCFGALDRLLAECDLPGELLAHLLWRAGYVREIHGRLVATLDSIEDRTPDASTANEVGILWGVVLDHLQSMVGLLIAEARRRPATTGIADAFEHSSWLVVRPWPEGQRVIQMMDAVVTQGAAPYPNGASYADSSPEARDRAGADTAARQRAKLTGMSEEAARVLGRF